MWTAACYAYYPVRLSPTLGEHQEVRVRADRPFPLRAPGAPRDAPTLCVTREVRGRLVRVIADTRVIAITAHTIEPQSGTDATPDCPAGGLVALVVSSNEHVTSNQLDAAKTILWLMAFGAMAILIMSLLYSA